MKERGKCRLLLAVLIIGFLGGCREEEPQALTDAQRATIQARVYGSFDNAVLFKPHEGGLESSLLVRLAPLLIQEVTDTNAANLWRDEFGMPDYPPLVVGQAGTTTVGSNTHKQFVYSWAYLSSVPPEQTMRTGQGVRLTLNSADAPVIWEVFEDSTGAEIIYVAQSLEQAARAEFGPPLPGRKFSMERGLAETPNVVVANVIEDGPVAMGPIVYLRHTSRDVTALICRCMPSQYRTLGGQKDYELDQSLGTNKWRNDGFFAVPLNQRLRIPARF